ncbi:Rho termination factor N-terminal domain-containing protein [Leifsonia sp. F6_8S_P_1B]|uniref:Rho termination factor N-terminal domain-containing protein n=1 Tax=Leifsonia williamsii TaxID=3035919 RepID=A0ABT8KG85_9MICO|nr:Rho termination factor N-terminal domain-containing protein [Leifsonia williamsii]MDN4615796.1 Rho termination factor N-terminal domain-containing protein [Leifsonia williamsii]
MAKQKKQDKLEKAAKKAYKRAVKAVDAAVEAAEAVDKKARKKAQKLRARLADAAGPRTTAGTRPAEQSAPDEPTSASAIDLTPPLPNVEDPTADTAAEFAGSTATAEPHDPALDRMTAQALRDVARARGLANVSRLSKAQLIERLSE